MTVILKLERPVWSYLVPICPVVSSLFIRNLLGLYTLQYEKSNELKRKSYSEPPPARATECGH